MYSDDFIRLGYVCEIKKIEDDKQQKILEIQPFLEIWSIVSHHEANPSTNFTNTNLKHF